MIPRLGLSEPASGEVKVDRITESKMSTVISMLPTSLQSRMRPIRLLHQSVSLQSLRAGITISDSASSRPRPLSEVDIASLAQGPDFVSRLSEEDASQGLRSEAVTPRPVNRPLCSEAADDKATLRTASGIHWKFAQQGTSLVSISISGDKPALEEEDVAFERKAFIDGITYLLKGLPRDLAANEIQQVRSALPGELAECGHGVIQPTNGRVPLSHSRPRSVLHRGVQMVAFNTVVLFHFLMPYLMLLLKHAARLERRYKVTEHLVAHGREIVNAVGRQGVSLTETISEINDSRIGQSFVEALAWTVDGISQGISDGVGEGLLVVGYGTSIQRKTN